MEPTYDPNKRFYELSLKTNCESERSARLPDRPRFGRLRLVRKFAVGSGPDVRRRTWETELVYIHEANSALNGGQGEGVCVTAPTRRPVLHTLTPRQAARREAMPFASRVREC